MRAFALACLLSLAACGGRSELGVPLPGDAGPDPSSCGAPWVIFTHVSDGTSQIFARRADGTDGHALALAGAQPTYPSVSPDGTTLLYAHDATQHLSLHRFADHTEQVLPTQGQVGRGSVSPDGSQVVYGDGNNLHLVGVSGSPAEHVLVSAALTPGNAAGFPSFTGDGQTVIYAAGGVVQSIGADGTGAKTLLTTDTSSVEFPNPTLSPDAASVAVIASCDGPSIALRTYPLASLPTPCSSGAVVTAVTDVLSYYDPAWGPTGLIAYATGQGMLIVSASGGTPTNLTADLVGPTAGVLTPTWAPSCASLP